MLQTVRPRKWRGVMAALMIAAAVALVGAQPASTARAASTSTTPSSFGPAGFVTEPAPTPPLTAGAKLGNVSCPTPEECWASTERADFNPPETPLQMLHWVDGTWSLVAIPTAASDVTCIASDNCWAVGDGIQHWDGQAWSTVESPTATTLAAVTCTNASNCWAAGEVRVTVSAQEPQFVHWNGHTWTAQKPPTRLDTVVFTDAACRTVSLCVAVGYIRQQGLPTDVYAQWNGAHWSFQRTTDANTQLNSVDCSRTTDCEAVGQTNNGQAITTHWDGTSWSPPQSLTTGSLGGTLSSVTCQAPKNCWAAGYALVGAPDGAHGLVEHWNGAKWSAYPTTLPAGESFLNGIACIPVPGSGLGCKAVGNTEDRTASMDQSLVETRGLWS
jgi:hypothetical protein